MNPATVPTDPGIGHNAIAGLVAYYAEAIGGLRARCDELERRRQLADMGCATVAAQMREMEKALADVLTMVDNLQHTYEHVKGDSDEFLRHIEPSLAELFRAFNVFVTWKRGKREVETSK